MLELVPGPRELPVNSDSPQFLDLLLAKSILFPPGNKQPTILEIRPFKTFAVYLLTIWSMTLLLAPQNFLRDLFLHHRKAISEAKLEEYTGTMVSNE